MCLSLRWNYVRRYSNRPCGNATCLPSRKSVCVTPDTAELSLACSCLATTTSCEKLSTPSSEWGIVGWEERSIWEGKTQMKIFKDKSRDTHREPIANSTSICQVYFGDIGKASIIRSNATKTELTGRSGNAVNCVFRQTVLERQPLSSSNRTRRFMGTYHLLV